MRLTAFILGAALALTGFAQAAPTDTQAQESVPEEIVITLEDLDGYAEAMLRVFALSNEISLRVAAKREDLSLLHKEFNRRALAILDRYGIALDRYNEIERASQLIPSVYEAIRERVLDADETLQSLAQSPKTMDDAKALLAGKVDYPINAKTMPWFAEDGDLESLASDHMGGGMPSPDALPGLNMPGF